mgnify:CR=1 FL=1
MIEDFALRHFIKSFEKKHQGKWDITLRAIIAELERIDSLLLTDRAEIISGVGEIKVVKTKFKVVGTQESAKTSGNRCIVSVDEGKRSVSVLLVYGKTDLSGKNETAEWKALIKDQYGIVCK